MPVCRQLVMGLLLVAVFAPTVAAQQTGVRWLTDLDQARQAAKQSGKLMLIHFWTETCGPCKRLEATVFNQPSVASAIDQHFVPVKVNADASPELAKMLQIRQVPTDVIATPDGKVVNKLVSPQTPMDYIAKMTRAAAAEATKAGAAFRLAAAESPYGPVVNQAYASLAPAPAKGPASAATPPTATALQPGTPQPPVTPATPPAVQTNPYTAAAPPTGSPNGPQAPTTASTEPAGASPTLSAPPALPAGSPPLGFDGFCTVTMKKRNTWQRGDTRYGVIHDGRTYLFAGAAERDAFFQDPNAYAPVLGGVDPVLALDKGRAAMGLRQYSLEYDGRFYLFSSEQTLAKFWQNSARYAEGARQAMSTGTTPRRR